MTFQENLKQLFIEHHNDMGMCEEEAEDLYEEAKPEHVEKFMKRLGYDLSDY